MAKKVSEMTIAEKVGQLFILAFPGKEPQDLQKARQIIAQYHISGCYISQDNAEAFEQAWKLSDTLQQAALTSDPQQPLILGVDQEGAWGVLIPQATIGPGNLALGQSEDTANTEKMYRIFAQEMLAVGYNTILGPCSDVNLDPRNPIIGSRSFGELPNRVAQHVRAAVQTFQQQGVLCSAKHFPGHGDTHSDTHREIPVVDKPLAVLRENELLPFQAAVDQGVDMIMTSHILYPQLDDKYPATLSHNILTKLLRDDMGFGGVIITDSMNMGAMRRFYTPEEGTVQALLAGADLVMLSEEHYDHSADYWSKQKASIDAVLQAVQQGRISEAQLDEKLERIVALKKKIQPGRASCSSISEAKVANGPQVELDIAKAAIRVLRNENAAFPLISKGDKGCSVALLNATPPGAYGNLMNVRGIGPNQAEPAFATFAAELQALAGQVPQLQLEVLDYDQAIAHLADYDTVIVVTEDHPLPGEDFDKTLQIRRVQQLQGDSALRSRLMVLALRSPYDLLEFPDVPCYICTYSGRSCSAQAAAQYLLAPT